MNDNYNASEDQEIVLTASGLLAFLSEIEELSGKENLGISVNSEEGGLEVYIGDSVYFLTSNENSIVQIPDEAVEEVQEINRDGYRDIEDEFELIDEPVQGGILKELIKTLAIGGLVRLAKSAITSD